MAEHAIDIALVLTVALIAVIGAKRGIIATVFDLGSGIISVLLAKLLCTGAAEYLYESVARERVMQYLTDKYAQSRDALADGISDVLSALDMLPRELSQLLLSSGAVDANALSESALSSLTSPEQLEQTLVAPVITFLLKIICFFLIACVSGIALRIVGTLISRLVRKTALAEKLDTALGAVFGVLKGFVYAFVLAAAVNIAALMSDAVAVYASHSVLCAFAASLIGL